MITPDFVGQIYKDTNTGNLWRANSLTPGDWTLELQNMYVKWEPQSINLGSGMGWQINASGYSDVTTLTFLLGVSIEGITINLSSLQELRFPNLTGVDPDFFWGSNLDINTCTALTLLELPLLNKLGSGDLIVTGSALTALSLASLVHVEGDINLTTNASLTSISVPLLVPKNGTTVAANGCALDATSVNQILARCVANAGFVTGNVSLGGGTNAAPTGQGVADKATLIGRGVSVSTN